LVTFRQSCAGQAFVWSKYGITIGSSGIFGKTLLDGCEMQHTCPQISRNPLRFLRQKTTTSSLTQLGMSFAASTYSSNR
jgi:hypothetical protein